MARRGPSPTQFLLIIALLVVAIALVRVAREGGTRQDVGGERLAPLPEEAVREVLFERGAQRIRVVLEADGFWIVEPYRDRADDRFLRAAIRVAATLAPERVLPDTAGDRFGLAPPAAAWSATWEGGRFRIVFGDTLPAGGGRYAMPEGSQRVWVLDPFLVRRYLTPPAREIHSAIPAPVGIGRVDSVRISTREEEVLLARSPGGEWKLLHPLRTEADPRIVQRAVNDLRKETITEILGPVDSIDLAERGLRPPRATWTLIQGGLRSEVRIGHPTPDQQSIHIIPAGRDVVALMPSESFRILVDGTARLRDPRLFLHPPETVRSIEIRSRMSARTFARSDGQGWVEIEEGTQRPVRSDAMETAIGNLLALRSIGFPDPAAGLRAGVDLTLRLGLRDGTVDTLQLARPLEGSGIAWAARRPGPAEVPAAVHRTWRLWLDEPLRP